MTTIRAIRDLYEEETGKSLFSFSAHLLFLFASLN